MMMMMTCVCLYYLDSKATNLRMIKEVSYFKRRGAAPSLTVLLIICVLLRCRESIALYRGGGVLDEMRGCEDGA